jgi:hypothetical protein
MWLQFFQKLELRKKNYNSSQPKQNKEKIQLLRVQKGRI